MRREIEEFWQAKRRIERKLLIGVGAALLVLGGAACTEGPTGPYTELDPQQGAVVGTQATQADGERTQCGDVAVSDAVCAKGLGEPDF
jgi:hypothetical protein